MTDEQLGRLWCERNGKRPDHWPRRGMQPWRWVWDDGPAYGLPTMLHLVKTRFSTEAGAYAAVGAALRELKRRADEIAAVLEGVPT